MTSLHLRALLFSLAWVSGFAGLFAFAIYCRPVAEVALPVALLLGIAWAMYRFRLEVLKDRGASSRGR